MNGRNVSSITNVTAWQVATDIFGSTLPNMDNTYMIADYSTGTRMTNVGQNSFTVANNNINVATLTTFTDGAHIHDVSDPNWGLALENGNNTNNGTDLDFSFNEINIQSAVLKSWQVDNTNSSHSHEFNIGTASPNSIDNRPVSKKMYAFVYLGQ
jgi:hypothetical protein